LWWNDSEEGIVVVRPGESAHRQGTVGRTARDSTPSFQGRPRPAGAPNVLVVLLDDIGFAQLGCFGGEVQTPTIDRLAADGLRYNRFHVTALCSPSRASLLTGRNHHAVGMGFLCDLPTGFPGYTSRIPRSASSVARLLRDAGYSTMAVGKWHLTPRTDRTAAGPFETWPLGLGFERFYGFLHSEANQWTPTLVVDNHFVEPPHRPEEGYHLTEDLIDTSLRMIHDQQHAAPGKPFFMYLAPGVAHAPHQVPTEWSDAYSGCFDHGWEQSREQTFARQVEAGVVPNGTVLPPRPPWIPAWDDLPADQRRLYARFQEVFAGFVTHFDHHLGRLCTGLESLGLLDDTMVIVASDNGASAEGGVVGSANEHRFSFGLPENMADNMARIRDLGGWRSYNHYPWGWAWAGNTPFRLWKRYTWLGGTRTPLVIRFPREIADPGAVRGQFLHIIDLMPTVLDVCGVEPPSVVDGIDQQPIDGVSARRTLADGSSPALRTTQYFEMLGSRAIYHDGWKATTDHVAELVPDEQMLEGSRDFDDDRWSLFRLSDDFSEANDRAAERPDLVTQLTALWEEEAARNDVLPLIDNLEDRRAAAEPALWPPPSHVVFRPGASAIADEAVPLLGQGSLVVADVEVPASESEGVLCAMGDWSNGWALVVLDHRPTFLLNVASDPFRIDGASQLSPGRHRIGFRFTPNSTGGGTGALLVDDCVAGVVTLPDGMRATGLQIGGGGLRLGHDTGFPVSDDYTPPFPWNGVLHAVTFDADAPSPEFRAVLADALHRE
jgi:arylsulfatase A-like enzyme